MATQPTSSIVPSSTTQDVDCARSLKSVSGFDLSSLPTPDRTSDVPDILDFISHDLGPDRLAEGHWFTRRQLHAVCEEFDFPYKAVWNEVRRQVFVDNPLNDSLTSEDVEITPSGIIVNKKAVRAITADLVTICPYKQRFMSTRNFLPYSKERPCGEPWHLPCGVKEAEHLQERMRKTISGLDQVYVTFCQWDPGLSVRMRQRRLALGMESMTYHRIDGLAFIVSDKAHRGRSQPISCQAKSPAEAMEWFTEAIYVPGRMRADWSRGWKQRDDDAKGSFDDIDLTHLSDQQVARVRSQFQVEARDQFGVEIETGYWPKDVRPKLVELMKKLVIDAGG